MNKVMMTYHLTVLRFLPATLPLRPLYSVIRTPNSVLCNPPLVIPLNSFARPCRRARVSPF